MAKLPAPSHLLVGELGLLDQDALWRTADRLVAAGEDVQRVQVSLGGLGGDEGGPPPAVIAEMEAAHQDLEAAEQAAESVRIPGVAGAGARRRARRGRARSSTPLLIPLGLLVAGAVGMVDAGAAPAARRARPQAVERAALERAGAPSYLSFHLRRVDATVDPNVRGTVELASNEHRTAAVAWVELVGPDVDVHEAKALEAEVRAYHTALQNLGGAADEIEQLRTDLAERAEPAVAATLDALAQACAPYGLSADDVADPDQPSPRAWPRRSTAAAPPGPRVSSRWPRPGSTTPAASSSAQLLQLGFDAGELDARVGALEWAVARATRARGSPRQRPTDRGDRGRARDPPGRGPRLHRPEWATVSPSEAEAPDIGELEERREKLLVRLEEVQPEVDVVRLADRQAAVERRVMALEARHGGHDANGDPGAVADIQQHLLGRLTQAATAGPQGDPVPAVLDEVFLRVPAERKWDLLDLLHRLSERHQLIYLSDDPFVAAWASQKAGDVSLLAPEPEPVEPVSSVEPAELLAVGAAALAVHLHAHRGCAPRVAPRRASRWRARRWPWPGSAR